MLYKLRVISEELITEKRLEDFVSNFYSTCLALIVAGISLSVILFVRAYIAIKMIVQ